jgi:hypothetical protein
MVVTFPTMIFYLNLSMLPWHEVIVFDKINSLSPLKIEVGRSFPKQYLLFEL